jgi:hypothetical protein
VSAELSGLVGRLLAKGPEGRPATAAAVAEELRAVEAALAGANTASALAPVPAPVPVPGGAVGNGDGAIRELAPRARRRRWPMVAAAAALLAVGVAVALLLRPRPSAPVEAGNGGTGEPPPAKDGPPRPALPPLKGYVDVQIYEEGNPDRSDRWLREPNVLPLRAGDRFAIVAELNRPA